MSELILFEIKSGVFMKTKCFIFILLVSFLFIASSMLTANSNAIEYYKLAQKCVINKDYTNAEIHFKRAIETFKQAGKKPPASLYRDYIDLLFEKLKKSAIALEIANEALSVYNNDPHLYRYKAYALGDLKRYTECFQSYDKAIELLKRAGKHVPYYFYTGAGYTAKKVNPEKALQYFLEVYNGNYSAKQKDSPIVQIANLYYNLKKYKEFITFADLYIKIGTVSEKKRVLYDLLANYYYRRGELEKALNYAKKVGTDFWITKSLRPRNVTLSFKLRFKDIIQKLHRRMINKKTFLIEAPLDTYYQKLVSVTSNPPFKRIVKKERMNWLEYHFSDKIPNLLEITCIVHIKPESV